MTLENQEVLLKEYGPEFVSVYERTREFTMTSAERMFALYSSVNYVARYGIPGDFVECGVWRGGSSMLTAETFLLRGERDRKLFLLDTYQGMAEPQDCDVDRDGGMARDKWGPRQRQGYTDWCYAPKEEVRRNMARTGYPEDAVRLVEGDVKDTLPGTAAEIEAISILRLDTDWYESTRCELEWLFPKLSPLGVLIVDDYGHWLGARKAVDEYFAAYPRPALLQRIDTTGRLLLKV